jgi:hypothetical protein
MRVDTDTYVWGVKRIVIERDTDPDSPRTRIRLIGDDGEDANTSLTVWGGRTPHVPRTMPEIVFAEDDGEPRTLVPAVPATEGGENAL